jgi:hypothetical protein
MQPISNEELKPNAWRTSDERWHYISTSRPSSTTWAGERRNMPRAVCQRSRPGIGAYPARRLFREVDEQSRAAWRFIAPGTSRRYDLRATITFKLTAPSRLHWAGRPAMRVVQALQWLRSTIDSDRDRISRRLAAILTDPDHGAAITTDLRDGLTFLPDAELPQASAGKPTPATSKSKPSKRRTGAPT